MGLNLNPIFVQQLTEKLGTESTQFLDALEASPPVSIRFNKHKPNGATIKTSGPVLWNEDGFYLEERPSFTYDPSFHAGVYYVQEASSMLVGHVVKQIVKDDWHLVIDLCAAPGGKTTDILNQVNSKTVVIANEVVNTRLGALRQNLIKWGHANAIACSYTTNLLAAIVPQADLVVVDAPCSGEGMFRKDEQALTHWSLDNQQVCVHRQKEILKDAAAMVKPGGYLIYSTCTYNSNENECQVDYLVKELGFKALEIDLLPDWEIRQQTYGDGWGYQCFPHRVSGEGFFIALLQKTHTTESFTPIHYKSKKSAFTLLSEKELNTLPNKNLFSDHTIYKDGDGNLWLGDAFSGVPDINHFKPLFELGALKGKDFIPAHSMSMLACYNDAYPRVALTYERAIKYLKKETLDNTDGLTNGWYYVTYEGAVLGFVKVVGTILKNHFPMNWRILK